MSLLLGCGKRDDSLGRVKVVTPERPRVWVPPPLPFPPGLDAEKAKKMIEESDPCREVKTASCPKGVDRHNLDWWKERHPALGILLMLDMASLGDPQMDPVGSQEVRLTEKGRSEIVGLEEDSANYKIPIATREVIAIDGVSARADGRTDVHFRWRYVPNAIGKHFPIGTQGRDQGAIFENQSGTWQLWGPLWLENGDFGPYDR